MGGTDGSATVEEQLIFAPDPGTGDLTEISNGHWVYFIRPEHLTATLPKTVRAELYRVDHAISQKGQRLVSSTISVAVPENLPAIRLTGLSNMEVRTLQTKEDDERGNE